MKDDFDKRCRYGFYFMKGSVCNMRNRYGCGVSTEYNSYGTLRYQFIRNQSLDNFCIFFNYSKTGNND